MTKYSVRGIAIGVSMIASASACGGKVDETPATRVHASCYAMCVRITATKCGGDEIDSRRLRHVQPGSQVIHYHDIASGQPETVGVLTLFWG